MPGLLLLTGLAVAVPYALACWLAPFGACARCHGRDRLCRACDGTGRRVRAGIRGQVCFAARNREEGHEITAGDHVRLSRCLGASAVASPAVSHRAECTVGQAGGASRVSRPTT